MMAVLWSRGANVRMLDAAFLLLMVYSTVSSASAPSTSAAAACTGFVGVVAVAPDGTAAELEAASLLAAFMGRLNAGGDESAPPLPVVSPTVAAGRPHVAIGVKASAALGVSAADLIGLGPEGFLLSSNRTAEMRSTCAVVLAGTPDSTIAPIYAAQQLLWLLGVRFLAWDFTHIPTAKPRIPFSAEGAKTNTAAWDIRYVPVFEYRNVDGWAALSHPAQARFMHLNDGPRSSTILAAIISSVHDSSGANSSSNSIRPSKQQPGLQKPYADPPGFVHTSYNMLYDYGKFPVNTNCSSTQCPPTELFKTHNEWFWPRNDPTVYGQLCWSNQSLIDYLTKACASFLTAQPHATIISASQNDNDQFCQSPEEIAINKAEGSPIGAMLRGVNAIAKTLAPSFPHVGFDTLGNYPDNQPIPRITKPEPNVSTFSCAPRSSVFIMTRATLPCT